MHEVETMFSARELPWHGLGTVTEEALLAEEAIEAAGLDWTVSLQPVAFQTNGGEYTTVPNRYAVVRDLDEKPLSVVGGAWTAVQNTEAFSFLNDLMDTGLAFETAGSLRGGAITFMTAKLPESILIGGEDAHDLYLFLKNSFDGRSSVIAAVTPIRIVCMNTLNLGLRRAQQSWSVAHTSTIHGRLAEAREALSLSFAYVEEFKATAEQLMASSLAEADFKAFLTAELDGLNLGERATSNAFAGITDLYHAAATTENIRGTKWGALNAVGEYFDWVRPTRTEEARLTGSLDGIASRARDKAVRLLTV